MKASIIKIETDNDTELNNNYWTVCITCSSKENYIKVEDAIINADLGESLDCPWDNTEHGEGYGDSISIEKHNITKGEWIKEIRKVCKDIRKELK